MSELRVTDIDLEKAMAVSKGSESVLVAKILELLVIKHNLTAKKIEEIYEKIKGEKDESR